MIALTIPSRPTCKALDSNMPNGLMVHMDFSSTLAFNNTESTLK